MKLVIIDDDPLVTTSLKTILEMEKDFEVAAVGHSGEEACQLYQKWEPDILLMDIRMGEMTGIMAAKVILKAQPTAKILLLTTFSDDEYIHEALNLGVKGYLVKQDFPSLIPAIKAIQSGQSVFGTEITDKLIHLVNHPKKEMSPVFFDKLTQREQEVLLKIAEGKNNKEIAKELFLSEGTVRNYISLLLEKLSLRDRTQLAIYYYQEK